MNSEATQRRDFRLSGTDEAFLNGLGLSWETVAENGQRWLIIYGISLPPGYNHTIVDMAILMAPGYPPGPLDMAHFHPPLGLLSGRVIPNTEGMVMINGKNWQAWSRHRDENENPWIEGEDDLGSHFYYAKAWLVDELAR